jgi:hypothetical protein
MKYRNTREGGKDKSKEFMEEGKKETMGREFQAQ